MNTILGGMGKREPSRVGVKIREFRTRKGLSQEQLADEAGVSRQVIARLEIGTRSNLRADSLGKIASALGVTQDALSGEVKVMPMATVVDRYLQSAYFAIDRPTAEEITWLTGLPPAVFCGVAPDEHNVHELILWRRRGSPRQ